MSKPGSIYPSKGANHGARDWIAQRLSALGLVWLCLWFAKFCIALATDSAEIATERFQSLYNASMWVLFLSFSFYHGWIGIKEILEDYIHSTDLKGGLKVMIMFGLLFLYTMGMLSVLKLFLG